MCYAHSYKQTIRDIMSGIHLNNKAFHDMLSHRSSDVDECVKIVSVISTHKETILLASF